MKYAWCALALASMWIGCGSDSSSPEVGDARLALSAPGTSVDSVEYTLTGPNAYRRTGTFSVTGPGKTFEHSLTGIPAGAPYEVALRASSTDNRKCSGKSATFTVSRGQSVRVDVTLSCEGLGRSGSVTLNGGLNTCPVVTSAVATPVRTVVGSSIVLSGMGMDEDTGPQALSYHWSAQPAIGTLSAENTNATFHCDAPGFANVTLTVADGDAQCSENNDFNVLIRCLTANRTACEECESGQPVCEQRAIDCETMSGQTDGVANSELCKQVADCIHTTGCANGSGFLDPSQCFCGQLGLEQCMLQPLAALTGACHDIIARGAASTLPADIVVRLGDPAFPTGRAFRRIQCEQRFCKNQCGFMEPQSGGFAGTSGLAGMSGGGSGGMGGEPPPMDACSTCESAPNSTCRQRYLDCQNIQGEFNGVPKSTLCRQVVDCVRTTKCATDSATDSPSDCLCGLDVDVGVCASRTLEQLTGECKDIIALGTETTQVLDISTRLGDPAYATGVAMRLIQCDMRFCANECSFDGP